MAKTFDDDVVYSDILMDFDIHPIKHDLVRAVNEAAVKRSIRNLLLTRKGERFFNMQLGAGLEQYLFEHISPQNTNAIKREVENTINNYEPRARLIGVKVTPQEDQNAYIISISFYIINSPDPVTFSVTLERIR